MALARTPAIASSVLNATNEVSRVGVSLPRTLYLIAQRHPNGVTSSDLIPSYCSYHWRLEIDKQKPSFFVRVCSACVGDAGMEPLCLHADPDEKRGLFHTLRPHRAQNRYSVDDLRYLTQYPSVKFNLFFNKIPHRPYDWTGKGLFVSPPPLPQQGVGGVRRCHS